MTISRNIAQWRKICGSNRVRRQCADNVATLRRRQALSDLGGELVETPPGFASCSPHTLQRSCHQLPQGKDTICPMPKSMKW